MPEKIRVLFIGELHSTHAQSWIKLLGGSGMFEIAGAAIAHIPFTLPFRQYDKYVMPGQIPCVAVEQLRPEIMGEISHLLQGESFFVTYTPETLLGDINALQWAMYDFAPHVVHTFGFTPAALVYDLLPEAVKRSCKWVLQTRGGSDVAFSVTPHWQKLFRKILPQADAVICDNKENFRFFDEIGAGACRRPELSIAPGTGGLRVEDYAPVVPLAARPPKLLWGKAYECRWSKGLPVLDGLAQAMEVLPEITATICTYGNPEISSWLNRLPATLKTRLTIHAHLPREAYLQEMRSARAVLMPSLVDGVPNTLYEACAVGAIPIPSPLPTITPFFKEEENVFYARNLYPDDVAQAIIKAFRNPNREKMVERNLKLVRELADRKGVQEKVLALYTALGSEAGAWSRPRLVGALAQPLGRRGQVKVWLYRVGRGLKRRIKCTAKCWLRGC